MFRDILPIVSTVAFELTFSTRGRMEALICTYVLEIGYILIQLIFKFNMNWKRLQNLGKVLFKLFNDVSFVIVMCNLSRFLNYLIFMMLYLSLFLILII